MERYILSIKYRIGERNVKRQLSYDNYDIAYNAMMDNFLNFATENHINPNGKGMSVFSKNEYHLDCWKTNKFSYFSDIKLERYATNGENKGVQ